MTGSRGAGENPRWASVLLLSLLWACGEHANQDIEFAPSGQSDSKLRCFLARSSPEGESRSLRQNWLRVSIQNVSQANVLTVWPRKESDASWVVPYVIDIEMRDERGESLPRVDCVVDTFRVLISECEIVDLEPGETVEATIRLDTWMTANGYALLQDGRVDIRANYCGLTRVGNEATIELAQRRVRDLWSGVVHSEWIGFEARSPQLSEWNEVQGIAAAYEIEEALGHGGQGYYHPRVYLRNETADRIDMRCPMPVLDIDVRVFPEGGGEEKANLAMRTGVFETRRWRMDPGDVLGVETMAIPADAVTREGEFAMDIRFYLRDRGDESLWSGIVRTGKLAIRQ